MSITAALVKELRDISGAGMMDAKKALIENNANKSEIKYFIRVYYNLGVCKLLNRSFKSRQQSKTIFLSRL